MRRTITNFIALAAIAGLFAGTPARGEHMAVIPSDIASKENYQVSKRMNWYTSLDAAKEAAQKERKLIFWVHMLGTIDGAT